MPTRDELLLVLDLTSTILRAGVGVTDLIRGPLVELPTRLGRKLGTTGNKVEDFLVGPQLFEAEQRVRQGEIKDFENVECVRVDERKGMEVTDWVGLEAVFRYALHTSLALSRPPLANNTVLCVPPSLPPLLLDRLHALLFERLLVPQLLLSTRPFFAAAAAGVLSAVVLDIGYRGEGSEVSAVHENAVLEASGGLRLPFVDEGVCDDYLALRLLEADPKGVVDQLEAAKGSPLGPGELIYALRAVVGELKTRDLIAFESPLLAELRGGALGAGESRAEGDEAEFDVAKVIVEGKVNDLVKKSKGKGGKQEDEGDEGEFVTVANPFAPPPAPPSLDLTLEAAPPAPHSTLRIGPTRHRYLEPLFFPSLISLLAPSNSSSPAAAQLGMTEYERFAPGTSGAREADVGGVHEAVGVVIARTEDQDVRSAVSENVVVVSSGRVASIKALGSTLTALLLPFRPDTDSQTLAAIAAEGGVPPVRGVRHARTPDYFANFKERAGEWACYLGGCIMGKLLIGDAQSKLFMSKADYAAHGPAYYRLLEGL
ncbi:hypothetical protein JCM8547_006749 [Rhodosporidiobolus lusitaniae]